jgi:ribosomal protein S18 acetylase RimI-like enzyme
MNPINRLVELFEDWNFLLTREGLITTIPLVAMEIARLPYRYLKFLIFTRSLDDPLPELQPKMPLEIRPFTESDLKFASDINRPSEAKLCASRLARGHLGLIAMNHVQVAGYAWGCAVIDGQVERIRLRLENTEILCIDAFTAPSYRGQGVQTALTLARLHLFQDLGYKRALCYIEEHNSPSIAVWQQKLNSSIIGRIDFKRFGPWYRVKLFYY